MFCIRRVHSLIMSCLGSLPHAVWTMVRNGWGARTSGQHIWCGEWVLWSNCFPPACPFMFPHGCRNPSWRPLKTMLPCGRRRSWRSGDLHFTSITARWAYLSVFFLPTWLPAWLVCRYLLEDGKLNLSLRNLVEYKTYQWAHIVSRHKNTEITVSSRPSG